MCVSARRCANGGGPRVCVWGGVAIGGLLVIVGQL